MTRRVALARLESAVSSALARYAAFLGQCAMGTVRTTICGPVDSGSFAKMAATLTVAFAAGVAPPAHAQAGGTSPAAHLELALATISARTIGVSSRPVGGISNAHRSLVRTILGAWCDPVEASGQLDIVDRNFQCKKVRGIGSDSDLVQAAGAEMIGARNRTPVFLADSDAQFVRVAQAGPGAVAELEPVVVLSRGLVERFSQSDPLLARTAIEFLVSRELALSRGHDTAHADFRATADACFVAAGAVQARPGVQAAFDFLVETSRGMDYERAVAGQASSLEAIDREVSSVRQAMR